MGDWAAQNSKKKKKNKKIKNKKKSQNKIQHFEFEAPYTNIFNINWNFFGENIFLQLIINILQYLACYLMTLVQSYSIFYKIQILEYFLENYHKIVWTAITHSSHHVKAEEFKTGKILIEKLLKQNEN